jgi:hypothetical protein
MSEQSPCRTVVDLSRGGEHELSVRDARAAVADDDDTGVG